MYKRTLIYTEPFLARRCTKVVYGYDLYTACMFGRCMQPKPSQLPRFWNRILQGYCWYNIH
jgi:hypothetical protein